MVKQTQEEKDETTLIKLRRSTKAKLDSFKVHPRQSYDEVLKATIKSHEEKINGEGL